MQAAAEEKPREDGREGKKKQEEENKGGGDAKEQGVPVKVNISIKRDSTLEFDCFAFRKVSGH